MGLWGKITSILRQSLGGPADTAQLQHHQDPDLENFEQDLQQADQELAQIRAGLVQVVTAEKLGDERISQIQEKIAKTEDAVRAALANNDESSALELAGEIGNLEALLTIEQEAIAEFKAIAHQLRQNLHLGESHLNDIKQQLSLIQSTDNIQQIQENIAKQRHHSALNQTLDILEQLKQQQITLSDKQAAIAELESELGSDLGDPLMSLQQKQKQKQEQEQEQKQKQKLKQAGVSISSQDESSQNAATNTTNAASTLERLKSRG